MDYIIPLYLHLPSVVLGMVFTLTATTIVLLIERIRNLKRKRK